ncbi:MAG: ABC transporter ATP-binding protein [Armatimonadetes bacterium]|nr:ABC transporter ATP-binding protein [Armatimonadota bacterium]
MVHVEGLGKRYGSRWLFRQVTFSLEPGEVLAVLGTNGAGKSTFLKSVVGLVAPNEGRVQLPEGDRRTLVGYAALDMSVYPHLSVREHLEFTAAAREIDSNPVQEIAAVGLAGAEEKLGHQLSTGMKTRLKLAMAVQAKPPVLVLDEPSAGLDDAGRALVERILSEQRERGLAILATNDPTERGLATVELHLEA